MINFQDKENVHPAMCSTPITKKNRGPIAFHRKPLTPRDINVKIKRSSPAEVELLKSYIEELHTSYTAQLKEQKSVHEQNVPSNKPETRDIQCEAADITGLSQQTQIVILHKKLMKSNVDRDRYEGYCRDWKSELEKLTSEHARSEEENAKLNRLITNMRDAQECTGGNCESKKNLLLSRQNYQILENSHKELELQVCHLATELERRNAKISEMFTEQRWAEEKFGVSEGRSSAYEKRVHVLETELATLKSSTSTSNIDLENLKQQLQEVALNKSKLRQETDFLLDERETREITLEEIYKQLTETRKNLASLRESEETLREQYEGLVTRSEELAKQYTTHKELVDDAGEISDYLYNKLVPVLPSLCSKHDVAYEEYEIRAQCPALIGKILFVVHAVNILEDLAGSVSLNNASRKQITSLKGDKSMLENTISEIKNTMSSKTERFKSQQSRCKVLTDITVQYAQTIESNELCIEELMAQVTVLRKKIDYLEENGERNILKLTRQTEDLAETHEQLQLYDEVLHTVKTRMLALGSSLPSNLKVVLKQLV